MFPYTNEKDSAVKCLQNDAIFYLVVRWKIGWFRSFYALSQSVSPVTASSCHHVIRQTPSRSLPKWKVKRLIRFAPNL